MIIALNNETKYEVENASMVDGRIVCRNADGTSHVICGDLSAITVSGGTIAMEQGTMDSRMEALESAIASGLNLYAEDLGNE